MHKILVVIGSRPEAIKAAPLIYRLRAVPSMHTVVCIAAQQGQKFAHELEDFALHADEELIPGADLSQGVDHAIAKHRPDTVLVYGNADKTMASFRRQAAFGNLGTGLRMYELYHHSPECEQSHKIDLTATKYFVSSERSRDNMLNEGVSAENLYVTDSTEVDAVLMAAERIRNDEKLKARLAGDFPFLDPKKRLILVTGSKQEEVGGRLESLCRNLTRLAMRPDVQLAFLLHPDDKGNETPDEIFGNHSNIALIQPRDFLHEVYLMQAAFLILSDPDDVPKGALSLKKPVLVMNDTPECREAAEADILNPSTIDARCILRECVMFLDDSSYYQAFSGHRNPYGDGHASQRIVETLLR
jgi:UDP-N-acetylglucosamine 2-epimerase (non-hydrolysing)